MCLNFKQIVADPTTGVAHSAEWNINIRFAPRIFETTDVYLVR
jgi:hypothetical protein